MASEHTAGWDDRPTEPRRSTLAEPHGPAQAEAVTDSLYGDTLHLPLRQTIGTRIAALLHASGVDETAVDCTIEGDTTRLMVNLELPTAVGQDMEHALTVRVIDAVHSTGRTYGRINVSVSPAS